MGDPFRTRDVMLEAHCRSRDVIRGGPGDFPVGITLAMEDLVAEPGGEAKRDEARAETVDVPPERLFYVDILDRLWPSGPPAHPGVSAASRLSRRR